MSGVNLRGRPRKGWMEGVESALSMRGLSVEQGRESARDRREWRNVVSGQMVTQDRGVLPCT